MHQREQSDLGPYCLQYFLDKNISRQAEQKIKGSDWQGRVNVNSLQGKHCK